MCRRTDQAGCTVVYGTYNAARRPSVDPVSRFGRAGQGTVAACVNPGAPAGGKAALDTYQAKATVTGARGEIPTAYVRLPGAVVGECVTRGEYSYLEVTEQPAPAGGRVVTLSGNVGNPPNPTWGMHNGDMSIPIGDLVRLAQMQYEAWARANR